MSQFQLEAELGGKGDTCMATEHGVERQGTCVDPKMDGSSTHASKK